MDLIVEFERTEFDDRLRHIAKLGLNGLPRDFRRDGIYFEFDPGLRVPEPLVLDGFMFCFLHLAMERATRLVIRGAISAQALRNAQLYQEAWNCWLPDRYRPIEIVPDRIVSEREFPHPRLGRAIAAYSGGLDSTAVILRHVRKGAGFHDLTTVLSVHGFDVRLDNKDGFDRLVQRTNPLLRSLELERRIVRTNIRQHEVQNWEHSFCTQLACAMHQFSHEFDYGLIASSFPYSHMITAWGSTASTDYLLSGCDFEIVHDAAGFSRAEKAALVSRHSVAREVVKVCWEGRDQHRNCGTCEKCVRTRLNFLLAGDENPPCFDTPFELGMIERIDVKSRGALSGLLILQSDAEKRGIRAPWVDALRAHINKAAPRFGEASVPARKAGRANRFFDRIRNGLLG